MTYLAAAKALHDVGLGALVSLVTHLIALEAQLGVTVKGVVSILAA